jgi:alginate O-acetyltransferase complex protein AlgI
MPILLGPDKVTYLVVATVCAIFPTERLQRLGLLGGSGYAVVGIQGATATALMAFSCMLIAANGFNPFIYFRF